MYNRITTTSPRSDLSNNNNNNANNTNWSVRAEFTISHPGVGASENSEHLPQTEDDGNGVRMTYSWNSREASPGYNFQKGNFVFTSVPPNVESSGYGSNYSSNSLKNEQNKRCKSTCKITLNATPSVSYYNCGDPWCARNVETKRDASVQTYEMVDKCTSPFQTRNKSNKVRKRSMSAFCSGSKRSSFSPDSLEGSTSNSRKPRTVHIDVYCTGTEVESSSDSDTVSTPRTVYETKNVRITHKRAELGQLPNSISENKELEISSSYPSKLSSYSTIRDFNSSISSVPYSFDSLDVPQGRSTDSFEYANSNDKLRIKMLEERLEPKDSDNSDDSGDGWSFIRASRTPSTVILMQKLSIDPTLRAPFTLAPGQYTEQRNVAKKFGQMVSVFKKPGHHVGPVRNPECSCAHCISYHRGNFRSRTRSVGDPPWSK